MPDSGLVLGADVGTTGCRVCLIDRSGRAVARSHAPYRPDRPRPGWAEQEASVWWRAFCRAAREAGAQAALGRVSCVCVTGQSTALLPLDKAGKPLRKAIIWQDTRAQPECDQVATALGAEAVWSVTGMRPAAFLLWPKVIWYMREQPDLFGRTALLGTVSGFVTRRLCGRTILSRAEIMGYPMNLETGEWWQEMCAQVRYPTGLTPPVVEPHELVGAVTAAAARETGLAERVPVAAGGMDTACAALAVGVTREGDAFEVSGTSGGIGVVASRPSASPALGVAHHVVPGLYINHAPMAAAGASLQWLRDVLRAPPRNGASVPDRNGYELMEEEASSLGPAPTGLLFLPYLAGERAPIWDARARGALVGLGVDTTRAQIVKAVMEGVAYGLRHNLEAMLAAGLRPDRLTSCGGGSRSPCWTQLKADVLGVYFIVHSDGRGAAFGAALLGGLAIHAWELPDLERWAAEAQCTVYSPRPALTEQYREHLRRYCALYPLLKDVF